MFLSKTLYPLLSTGSTQEDLSRHNFKHFKKTLFYFLISYNYAEFFNCYLSSEKSPFADNSRAEPSIFFMEKISFSLKL